LRTGEISAYRTQPYDSDFERGERASSDHCTKRSRARLAMIDRSLVGHTFQPVHTRVDADGVRRFAAAIGDTDPVYYDEAVAIERGFRSIPIPPTYVFSLKHHALSPEHALETLGIDAGSGKLLHAEQSFSYHRPICVGDELTFVERVADVYEKKGGSLRFMVLETIVTDQFDEEVAAIRHTEVLRVDP
jgi:acyl dehydratase